MTDGKEANKTGRELERFVRGGFDRRDYLKVTTKEFDRQFGQDAPIYAEQYYMGDSIYGTPFKIDFVAYHPLIWPEGLALECKWQQVAGSVDEKFPYMFNNLSEKSKYPFAIVLDGGGYKPGAYRWLRRQVGGKFVALLSMADFHTWINKKKI